MHKFRSFLVTGLFLLSVSFVSRSYAYDIFLTSPEFRGNIADRFHRDAVGILAIKGPTKSGESGPLVLSKNMDNVSNALFGACLSGRTVRSIVIDIVQNFGGQPQIVSKITLTNAVIRNIEFKYEGTLVEEVTISYDAIKWEYTEFNAAGAKGGTKVEGWDNKTGKKLP